MKNRLILFFTLFLLWLLLSWSVSVDELLAGLFFSLVTAYVTDKLFGDSASKPVKPANYLWFAVYAAMLVWDIVKAAGDSFFRLVNPTLSVKPRMLDVKTSLKYDSALAILAGTITLLPGTVAVDSDPERSVIRVYCTAGKTDSYASIIELALYKYEKILKKVYE